MNQIIYPEKIENNLINYNNNLLKRRKIYRNLFIFSLILLSAFIIYYNMQYLRISAKEKISKNILSVYDIQQLYTTSSPVSLPSIILENGDSTDILGILQIDKINIRYPILSKSTEEFLEVSVCKFYGNELNDSGNFCIVGHNYNSQEFFSNLNKLEIGDSIVAYSLNRLLCVL